MTSRPAHTRRLHVIGTVVLVVTMLAGCARTVDGDGAAASSPISHARHSSASAAPEPSASAAGRPITFASCESIFNASAIPVPSELKGKINFGCAKLPVPLDYDHPDGKKIGIELVRVHYTGGGKRIGSLLVNPGGPGGSGVELALGLTGQLSPQILKSFDLIGFDPRGVQLSSPIVCTTDEEKDELNSASPDVLTPAGFTAAKAQAKRVADACEDKYGAALAQYSTVNTARDMDLIRQAVGDAKMNYLGFSYGTELGSIYAHLFPDKVRVAVLDGAVDPLTDDITSFANQLGGFESAFDQFAAWCKTNAPCNTLPDPRKTVYSIVVQARKHPLQTGTSRPLTVNLALTGVLQALYSKSSWSTLGDALVAANRGEGKGLLQLADQYNQRYNGHYSNIADANLTISCNDSKPGPTNATIRATAKQWSQKYPMFGTWAAASLFACQAWQPDRTIPPLPKAATPNKVLIIGNLHDPATPYQGARDLAKTMGNAALLSWDGEGHTSYLKGSSCVDDYVNNYLISLKLPPPDTTCPK